MDTQTIGSSATPIDLPDFQNWRAAESYGRRIENARAVRSKMVRGTKKAAEKALREVLGRKDKGYAVPSPSRLPTLRAFVATWKQAGAVSADVREGTFEDYLERLDLYVLPKLGEVRLDAIHAHLIKSEVMKPLREAGKLRTAQLAKAALSKVMEAAVDDRSLGLVGNPCHGVEAGGGTKRRVAPMDAA